MGSFQEPTGAWSVCVQCLSVCECVRLYARVRMCVCVCTCFWTDTPRSLNVFFEPSCVRHCCVTCRVWGLRWVADLSEWSESEFSSSEYCLYCEAHVSLSCVYRLHVPMLSFLRGPRYLLLQAKAPPQTTPVHNLVCATGNRAGFLTLRNAACTNWPRKHTAFKHTVISLKCEKRLYKRL